MTWLRDPHLYHILQFSQKLPVWIVYQDQNSRAYLQDNVEFNAARGNNGATVLSFMNNSGLSCSILSLTLSWNQVNEWILQEKEQIAKFNWAIQFTTHKVLVCINDPHSTAPLNTYHLYPPKLKVPPKSTPSSLEVPHCAFLFSPPKVLLLHWIPGWLS